MYNNYYSEFDIMSLYNEDNQLYTMMNEVDYDSREKHTTKGLADAIQLIQKSIESEKEDEMFYDFLISEAPNQEEKEIITSIRNDERKHKSMFRRLYIELTGKHPHVPNTPVNFTKPNSYFEGLVKALFGELKAVEKYRKILFELKDRSMINMLVEIITDEQKHAAKYNYLITLNNK